MSTFHWKKGNNAVAISTSYCTWSSTPDNTTEDGYSTGRNGQLVLGQSGVKVQRLVYIFMVHWVVFFFLHLSIQAWLSPNWIYMREILKSHFKRGCILLQQSLKKIKNGTDSNMANLCFYLLHSQDIFGLFPASEMLSLTILLLLVLHFLRRALSPLGSYGQTWFLYGVNTLHCFLC